MPIIKTEKKLVLYCHIPKCGGTTVTKYLTSAGYPMGFVNTSFKGEALKWSKTSPQHIDLMSLETLNMMNLIDESFAVVRHPMERFVSAFQYNKKNGRIPFWMPLQQFLNKLARADDEWHFKLDNHFRPMSQFVNKQTQIIKIEAGNDAIVNFLNKITGNQMQIETLSHENPRQEIPLKTLFSRTYIKKLTTTNKISELTNTQKTLIFKIYKEDFGRFDYETL